jgi:hypothetical protein
MPRLSGALAGAIVAIAACAAHAGPVKPGDEQGLGLLPHAIPDELKKAEANPYAMPPEPVCANIDNELASLEQILGPDVDGVQAKDNKAADLIGGAVRGAIPYRSWIRKITGAERREKKRDKDLLAAWERRGYLKGLAREKQCLGPVVTAEAPAAVDAAAAETPPADEPMPASETGVAPQPAVTSEEPLPPAEPAGPAFGDEAPPPAEPGPGR